MSQQSVREIEEKMPSMQDLAKASSSFQNKKVSKKVSSHSIYGSVENPDAQPTAVDIMIEALALKSDELRDQPPS